MRFLIASALNLAIFAVRVRLSTDFSNLLPQLNPPWLNTSLPFNFIYSVIYVIENVTCYIRRDIRY